MPKDYKPGFRMTGGRRMLPSLSRTRVSSYAASAKRRTKAMRLDPRALHMALSDILYHRGYDRKQKRRALRSVKRRR